MIAQMPPALERLPIDARPVMVLAIVMPLMMIATALFPVGVLTLIMASTLWAALTYAVGWLLENEHLGPGAGLVGYTVQIGAVALWAIPVELLVILRILDSIQFSGQNRELVNQVWLIGAAFQHAGLTGAWGALSASLCRPGAWLSREAAIGSFFTALFVGLWFVLIHLPLPGVLGEAATAACDWARGIGHGTTLWVPMVAGLALVGWIIYLWWRWITRHPRLGA